MFGKKYGNGTERDTRIVLNQEADIARLEYARCEIIRQLEENMKEYAKILDAPKSEKKRLAKHSGGKLGRAKNDFSGFKKR